MEALRSTHQGNEKLIDKNHHRLGEHGGKKAGKCSPVIGGSFGDRKNSPINILKRSIRRAWTINVPPGHWTISRKSPAFRIYRSLPLSKKNNNQSDGKNGSNEGTNDVNNLSVKSESFNGKNRQSSSTVIGKKTLDGKLKYNGERKSNIPIYRRNSREFEDISSPRETTKRSFIPQRYRGSTDDLRKYRGTAGGGGDDSTTTINSPSQIPKLQLSQKLKDDKLKRNNNNTDNKLNIKKDKDIINKKNSPIIAKKFSKSDINLTSTRLKFNLSQDSFESSDNKTYDQSDSSYTCNFKKQHNELTSGIVIENEDITMANDEKICQKLNENPDNPEIKNTDELIIDKFPENSSTNFSDNESVKAVNEDAAQIKKSDDIQQVICRKYSKEEFSNTDDTDDAPNRRSSSQHLSPEASPLSTRSSRYSPRESESEPTPALPRKTSSGDSCISSQRIRDAISRTRRESTSSARCESSGSESIRLSESGLHSYVDLARKVRLFGNSYCCPGASIDESIQRDSATTSAGEDEPHEDSLSRDSGRASNIANQGRTILRRRRQFDSQGSRRRGRSHARTCCSEDLQNLQGPRQNSPLQSGHIQNHQQEPPSTDYRRLVFISSDSSSGREEDDADSSCSGSSYLNGLPRNAHGLEDCDWDYFESGTLPLPTNLTDNILNHSKTPHGDLTCCPGRGSVACVACGGSPGGKVLPVPVPIPVLYPVPIPAALWNVDFAAVANSMITGSTTPDGTLRLRGDSTAPWFSWHQRFNQQFQAGAIPRGRFDPSLFTFRPDELASLGHFTTTTPTNNPENPTVSPDFTSPKQDVDKNDAPVQADLPSNPQEEGEAPPPPAAAGEEVVCDGIEETKETELPDVCLTEDNGAMKKRRTCCLSRGDSGSSSGRSSADSSELDDTNSYHFSRVFVVNDEEYNSDNEGCREIAVAESYNDVNDGITLKHMAALSDNDADESPAVVLKKMKSISENFDNDLSADDSETSGEWSGSVNKSSHELIHDSSLVESSDIFLNDSIDNTENSHVQLRSIRKINTESNAGDDEDDQQHYTLNVQELNSDIKSWDSNVTPDSLEIGYLNISNNDTKLNKTTSTESCSEINTTGSEFSSDELHEYEVSCLENNNSPIKSRNPEKIHKLTPMPKVNAHQFNKKENVDKRIIKRTLNVDRYPDKIPNYSHEKEEIIKNVEKLLKINENNNNDSKQSASQVKGKIEDSVEQVGDSEDVSANVGDNNCSSGGKSGNSGEMLERGTSRFHSVEPCPPTCKENGFLPSTTSTCTKSTKSSSPSSPSETITLPPSEQQSSSSVQNYSQINKYKSLVMITQGAYQPVSVVTSDTTTLLEPDENPTPQGLAGYYHLALESVTDTPSRNGQPPRRPLMIKRSVPSSSSSTSHTNNEQEIDSGLSVGGSASESDDVQQQQQQQQCVKNLKHCSTSVINNNNNNSVQSVSGLQDVVGGSNNKIQEDINSGIVILEEGLADDDSWVEEVSHDEDEQSATPTEESSEDEIHNIGGDREEELRGYHRQSIDFTLHTIVEESCEESEAELSLSLRKNQRPPSASDLEKYFFFGLGGDGLSGNSGAREIDSLSETSSIYSEGLESLGQDDVSSKEKLTNDLTNSSRLEKYFLSEFLGFDQDRRDSDGSVGSDSEGRPSPEAQRRKRLVRARGTGRSHSSSLDNLLALTQQQTSQNLSSQNSLQDLSIQDGQLESQSEGSSTETDAAEDGGGGGQTAVFGTDGQFDTVKRKKKKPRNLGTQSPRVIDDKNKSPELILAKSSETLHENDAINSDDDRSKTPQPELAVSPSSSSTSGSISSSTPDASSSGNFGDTRVKQQSRDSGFVGSCDDLIQSNQKLPTDTKSDGTKDGDAHKETGGKKSDIPRKQSSNIPPTNPSLSRKDSFNNWSSDEETNLMMSKMRQFFKTMVANSNGPPVNSPAQAASTSSGPSPVPSPRLSYTSVKSRMCPSNRTKPPQLVYFENELTRLMKTVPGIRDEQVREIVEYLSSEDTWSDSYDSSDYTSSDLEGAGGRRSALQEQISQSCQQIINKFDINSEIQEKEKDSVKTQPSVGRDTAFVYQKLVQSFTKMAGDNNIISPDNENLTTTTTTTTTAAAATATPHSSPPLIAKVMHHIGSRLVALMHEVSEGNNNSVHHATNWRRYSQHHHHTPSSASTTEDDDSTSDSTTPASSSSSSHPHFQLPRSKSHDPLLLINGHPAVNAGQEGEEREASDYERFSWRGSFESALMAADSRTKLSLLACSGDVNSNSNSTNALVMAAKRRSAGDLLFNPKSFSREQLDRVRSCGSIGGGNSNININNHANNNSSSNSAGGGGGIEDKIWSNRRRSSVPDANTRGESGASAGDDDDTDDEMEYSQDSRATTLPRGLQATTSTNSAATNSLPRLPASVSAGSAMMNNSSMHKAHSMYHFLPQHTNVKSARYRPPGFARNSCAGAVGPKRAFSAPGLQIVSQSAGKRETSRSRRQQITLTPDDGSSLSEACSTPIIGSSPRQNSSRAALDIGIDEIERGALHPGHNLNTRASLSSLGARSDSMASVYSGAGEGRWCGSVAVRGEVEFSLQYDYKNLSFEVHVSQCKDLAPVDIKRNRSDPYVKVYLLPDKSKSGKRKTRVKKHTLNPVFDETLKFQMSLNGLETRTLWLTVWHSDMFGRNDFLGEVRMPLENKIFDDPSPKWYPLQERTEPFDDPISHKGEVIVGLKFEPLDPTQLERDKISSRRLSKGKNLTRGSLHVLVREARNLQTRAKNSGTCDPFCKSYLLPDKGRSGKQKTSIVRRSDGSPVWGHTFVYKDVSIQELAERGLELTVWDHDRIASNEFLGGVRFNLGTGKHYGKPVDWMDATGRELALWQNMLERTNYWVEGAVTLRPNLHNHGKNSFP